MHKLPKVLLKDPGMWLFKRSLTTVTVINLPCRALGDGRKLWESNVLWFMHCRIHMPIDFLFFLLLKKISLWYILVEEWESMILFCFFCLMWFSKREIICRPHWGRVVIKPSTMLCKIPVIYDLCYRRDTHRSKTKLFLLVVKRQSPNPKLENGNDELHYDRYPHFHTWQ